MKPFDLQVNGYAGTDFNGDNLTAESLHHACECLVEDGCDAILATFITDHVPTLERRIGKLVELREKDALARQMITGIHIEGPFINPIKGYVGAHPPQAVKP
ncbi:MAG: N-acetylglucosamine-6-phosphate deacetylase, partial [Prosthecobacter sp.]|nr:N-acetylglucosamine-6-phosphate deacetylase [Prosthecobacter sp.]